MSSIKFFTAVQEVRSWLSHKSLSEFLSLLVDNGYDDLDAIAQCTAAELKELESLFQKQDNKDSIRKLVLSLQKVGIAEYRNSKSPGHEAFLKLLSSTSLESLSDGVSLLDTVAPPSSTSSSSPASSASSASSVTPMPTTPADIAKALEAVNEELKKLARLEGYVAVRKDRKGEWADRVVTLEPAKLLVKASTLSGAADAAFDLGRDASAQALDDHSLQLVSGTNSTELGWSDRNEQKKWTEAIVQRIKLATDQRRFAVEIAKHEQAEREKQTLAIEAKEREEAKVEAQEEEEEKKKAAGGGGGGASASVSAGGDAAGKKEETKAGPADEEEKNAYDEMIADVTKVRMGASLYDFLDSSAFVAKPEIAYFCGYPLPKKRLESTAPIDVKLRGFIKLLIEGDTFTKYRHSRGSKRVIWTTALLDYVMWSESDKTDIKNYLNLRQVQECTQGFGSKKKCFIYLITANNKQTLELEAKSTEAAQTWVEAFSFVAKTLQLEEAEREKWKKVDLYNKELTAKKDEYVKLLTAGDVFTKWPPRGSTGKKTVRRLWTEANLARLFWGEVDSKDKKAFKGYLQTQDIVQIQEDSEDKDKQKLTIVCVGRCLDLEAKGTVVRDKWIRAMRYLINDRKHTPPKESSDD